MAHHELLFSVALCQFMKWFLNTLIIIIVFIKNCATKNIKTLRIIVFTLRNFASFDWILCCWGTVILSSVRSHCLLV